MSRCWCETEGIQISECSECSGTDHGKTSPWSEKSPWLAKIQIDYQNLHIYRFRVVHLPLVIGIVLPSQGLPSKNARTLWVWLAWRMAMDCLWRRSLSPKNPARSCQKNGSKWPCFLLFLPRCLLIQLPSDRSVSEELIYERWYSWNVHRTQVWQLYPETTLIGSRMIYTKQFLVTLTL